MPSLFCNNVSLRVVSRCLWALALPRRTERSARVVRGGYQWTPASGAGPAQPPVIWTAPSRRPIVLRCVPVARARAPFVPGAGVAAVQGAAAATSRPGRVSAARPVPGLGRLCTVSPPVQTGLRAAGAQPARRRRPPPRRPARPRRPRATHRRRHVRVRERENIIVLLAAMLCNYQLWRVCVQEN